MPPTLLIINEDYTTMRMKKNLLLVSVLFFLAGHGKSQVNTEKQRDPHKWPFSQTSIWNMSVGSGAIYVHARIEKALAAGMTIDEDCIVMSPDTPLMDIGQNFAGWDRNKNRCAVEGKVLFSAPIPSSFIVGPQTWIGTTPNAGLAVLMPDGRTIRQTQPFSHCSAGQSATSQFLFEDQDIYGDGFIKK